MSRRRSSIALMCLHKSSGRAVVYLEHKPHYLGPWDSTEAAEAYGELIKKLAQGQTVETARSNQPSAALRVSDLLLKYVTEELPRYTHVLDDQSQRAMQRSAAATPEIESITKLSQPAKGPKS